MTAQPHGSSEPNPLHTLRNAAGVCLFGILVVLAATVDPWLLVMLAGLAVTFFTLTREQPPGHPDPLWDLL